MRVNMCMSHTHMILCKMCFSAYMIIEPEYNDVYLEYVYDFCSHSYDLVTGSIYTGRYLYIQVSAILYRPSLHFMLWPDWCFLATLASVPRLALKFRTFKEIHNSEW